MNEAERGVAESSGPVSIADAKAKLMAWADEHDAAAKAKGPRYAMIAAGVAMAVVGGMAATRVLSSKRGAGDGGGRSGGGAVKSAGRSLLVWALVAGAKRWALPMVQRLWASRPARSGQPG